jgi:hypothetical protein
VVGSSEPFNEHSGFIKGRRLLTSQAGLLEDLFPWRLLLIRYTALNDSRCAGKDVKRSGHRVL